MKIFRTEVGSETAKAPRHRGRLPGRRASTWPAATGGCCVFWSFSPRGPPDGGGGLSAGHPLQVDGMSDGRKRSARDIALEALMQVDKANAWSDEALKRLIAKNGAGQPGRGACPRLCYGVIQNRMLLDYYIGCWCAQKPERLEPVIRSILRIGGYQILFMDKVPHRAAVNEAVEMTRATGGPRPPVWSTPSCGLWRQWMDMPPLPKGVHGGLSVPAIQPPRWLVRAAAGPDRPRGGAEAFLRLDNQAVPTAIQTNP